MTKLWRPGYIAIVSVILALIVAACSSPASAPPQAKPAETKPAAEVKPAQPAKPAEPAKAAEKIVWKGVAAWAKGYTYNEAFDSFLSKVSKSPKLAGKFEIQNAGGPEVIPPTNQLDGLQKGVVQVVFTASAYFAGALPIDEFFELSSLSASESRSKGILDFMNEVNAKIGARVLFTMDTPPRGQAYALFVQKPVSKIADFKGLKIRSSPAYVQLVDFLGGTTVQMPVGETFTALQQGVVDGYGTPIAAVTSLGLNEVTKYMIDHRFYNAIGGVVVSASAWNRLPKDVQDELTTIAKEMEAETGAWHQKVYDKELDNLKKAGVQFVKLPGDEGKKYVDAAYDAKWAYAYKRAPEDAPKLRQLLGLPALKTP